MNPALCLSLLCMSSAPALARDSHEDLAKLHSEIVHGSAAERARAWKDLARTGEKGYATAFAAMARKQDQERATWLFQRAGAKAASFLEGKLDTRKRQQAAWALKIIAASPMLSRALLEKTHRLITHQDELVRRQALHSLKRVRDPRVQAWLIAYIKKGGNYLRQSSLVCDLMARHCDPKALATELRKHSVNQTKGIYPLAMTLSRLKNGKPWGTYEVLLSALARMGNQALPSLQGLLQDPLEGNRRAGALAIAVAGPEAGPLLERLDESADHPSAWTWLAHLYAIEKQGRAPAWLIPRLRKDIASPDSNIADASLRAYRSLCEGVHVAIRNAHGHPTPNQIASVAALGQHAKLAIAQLALIPRPSHQIQRALRAATALPLDSLERPNSKTWHQDFLENQVMR